MSETKNSKIKAAKEAHKLNKELAKEARKTAKEAHKLNKEMAKEAHALNKELVKAGIEDADALILELSDSSPSAGQ